MPNETWWIECGAYLPNNKFTRNHLMPLNEAVDFRFKYDNTGVFTTAYMYDNKDQSEANLLGDFYIDLDYELQNADDKEKAFNVVRQDAMSVARYLKILLGIEPEEIYFYFSGSKGIHIIVPHEILGIKPDKNLHRYYKMLAEDINKYTSGETVDLKIYDNRRLFRLPNSRHQSTSLYKIYLSYEELSTLSFSAIISIAKNPRIIPKKEKKLNLKANMEIKNYAHKFDLSISRSRVHHSSDLKLDYTPPCVDYLFNHPVKKGQRNDTVAFIASFLKQTGITEEQAVKRMQSWNEEYCEPKLSDREISLTVNSIFTGSAKMGCSTAKILSECNKQKCELNKKRR